MGFNLTESSDPSAIPIFQKVIGTVRGGLTLDTSALSVGDVIKAGTPMTYDETTRLATVAVDSAGSDAKGLLYEEATAPATDDQVEAVDVVIRGTVYKNRIPTADLAAHMAVLPLIIFSESY